MTESNIVNKELPPFSGIHTFHSLPYQSDLSKVDYAVVGAPFDTGAVNRCGARYEPMAIRSFCSFSNSMSWNTNLEVCAEKASGTDLGEILVKNGYTKPSLRLIEEALYKIYDSDTVAVVMGGGQVITLAELRALNHKYGKMALIHFSNDRSVTEHGDFIDDGNMLLNAVSEGLIDTEHSIQLGMRGGYNNKKEKELFKDQGMKVLEAYEMHQMSLDEIIKTIKDTVNSNKCIISLDLGFLDPTNAPAVDNPKMGGFTTYDIRTILRDIIQTIDMKSFDIVNLTYMFDVGEISSQACDGILTDVVCAMAKKKENGGV